MSFSFPLVSSHSTPLSLSSPNLQKAPKMNGQRLASKAQVWRRFGLRFQMKHDCRNAWPGQIKEILPVPLPLRSRGFCDILSLLFVLHDGSLSWILALTLAFYPTSYAAFSLTWFVHFIWHLFHIFYGDSAGSGLEKAQDFEEHATETQSVVSIQSSTPASPSPAQLLAWEDHSKVQLLAAVALKGLHPKWKTGIQSAEGIRSLEAKSQLWLCKSNQSNCQKLQCIQGKHERDPWRFHCSIFFWQTLGWIHFLLSLSVF